MKGTLYKNKVEGWLVLYTVEETWDKCIPIHPDYEKYYFLDDDADGTEVEFEIAHLSTDPLGRDVKPYAKLINQVPDVRKMVEDDATPIDWLINQLENHIVLSAHGKLGTNRTGDYRIGLRKAIDFCHEAKEREAKETLYTEEQVREAISKSVSILVGQEVNLAQLKELTIQLLKK